MRHGSGDAAGPRRLGEARRIGTGGTGGVSDTHLFGIGSDVPFEHSVRRRVTFDYSVSVGCCSTTPCGAG
ncbi:hypothetical protein [Salinispora arenicola]|nr:hypothetical protein [Salinispora arenicola]MCN0150949.1 hypothetical protein [Salinispora arenicola]TQL38523.1 hypothetical protein FB564_3723 [Salinispora arenicola]